MMRNLLFSLASLAWGTLVFMVALRVHFPSDDLLARAKFELQRASKDAYTLDAADASASGLAGLSLTDATFYRIDEAKKRRRPKRNKKGAESDAPSDDAVEAPKLIPLLHADDLSARLLLLPMLRGGRMIGFDASLYGGELSGEAGTMGAQNQLELDIEDIDLSTIPFAGKEWSVDAGGRLKMAVDLVLGDDPKESEGDLKLEIEELAFSSASVAGMTFDDIRFDEAVLEFEVAKGKAKVTKGRFHSEPVSIVVGGEIALNKELSRSRLALELEITFSEEYDRFAQMVPSMKKARDEDGVYQFVVTGSLFQPFFRENRVKVPGEGAAVMDQDEVRARRDERLAKIKDRRERIDRGEGPQARKPMRIGGAGGADDASGNPSRRGAGPRQQGPEGDNNNDNNNGNGNDEFIDDEGQNAGGEDFPQDNGDFVEPDNFMGDGPQNFEGQPQDQFMDPPIEQ